jgi:hypothetical protein
VIVGAPSRNNGPGSEGRAYLYLGSASGLATTPAWTKDGEQSPSYFGTGVATAGDVNGDGYSDVVVGSSRFTNAQVDEGRAYLYLGSASGLATSASWTTEADHPGAEFGASVTTAGDVNGDGFSDLLVSAYAFDVAQENDGKVLLYLGAAAGLSTTPAWTGTSAQNNAQFGIGMGPAGDVNGDGYSDVIIGAGLYDNGQTNEGRAFVYMGSASGLASISATTVESDQSAAGLGASLASAGDVNGDGYSDVIVGAPYYDNGESDEGGAFVYMGSAMGLSTTAAWTSESNAIDAHFGQSVATAGDVNGDGFSDVIVGAEQYTLAGAAFVFLGSGSGLAANASWMAIGQQNLGEFGRSVASAGDVNGDGFGDVIVGANAQPLGGRAFVYFGSASGLAASANWSAQSDQGLSHFGFSVASAGDVNGDGNSDVIVGANLYTNGQTNEGRAFVYHGSRSGLSSTADWTAEGNQAAAYFGLSVRSAGDVNGDGFSDVIVGAPHYSNGESMEGRAYVYLGSSQGLSMNASWTAEGQQSSANFGVSAASAGDVNGDGYSDAIVGSNGYDNDQADEGRAFVYLGSASGLSASAAWTAESNQVDPNFGMTVATAGDVNGDGYSDVIVGAYTYDGGQVNEGRTFLYLGNEGRGGWTLAPQQRQANDAAPIDLLGRSSDKHEFRIRLGFERETTGFAWASGVTPTARLEWEVRPLGTPFDGTHIKSGADQTITGSPLTFNELAEFHSTPNPALTVGNNNHTLFDARLAFHWRARVRTNNPLFPVTPWVSIPWNNVTEAKLRAGAIQRKLP